MSIAWSKVDGWFWQTIDKFQEYIVVNFIASVLSWPHFFPDCEVLKSVKTKHIPSSLFRLPQGVSFSPGSARRSYVRPFTNFAFRNIRSHNRIGLPFVGDRPDRQFRWDWSRFRDKRHDLRQLRTQDRDESEETGGSQKRTSSTHHAQRYVDNSTANWSFF